MKGKKLYESPPQLPHTHASLIRETPDTRAASIRELSDNDDDWTNSQIQRTFLGRINGSSNHSVSTHWAFRCSLCLLASLIRPRGPGTNQEGANVWHRTPRPIWTLGLKLQLYHTAHKPNPLVQNWALSLQRPQARASWHYTRPKTCWTSHYYICSS